MKNIAIGVDIGGSHVSCMGYDIRKKVLLPENKAESEVNNAGTADEILGTWGGTIAKVVEQIGEENFAGVGFAMPGPFDYVKGISLFEGTNEKYKNTYGMNVPELLNDFLALNHKFKCRFINDASAFAIGEAIAGKAKGFSRSLSVTLGTGFGSAFIKDGLPVVEGSEVPENGCLWHLPFEGGIADDYFSTRGLVSRFEKLTGIRCKGVKQIADQADAVPETQELFSDFGEKMAMFLQPWIESFGIEAFVIGGNVSGAFHLFGPDMQACLKQAGLSIEISISEMKEQAAFMGSAILVDDVFYQKVLPAVKKM